MDNLSFGKHVKRLREVRGMSQERLAERSDVSADTIRRLENADFSPSLKTLRKVCVGLGISLNILFSGFELPEAESALDDLIALLRGRSRETLEVVTRVVREVIRGLDE